MKWKTSPSSSLQLMTTIADLMRAVCHSSWIDETGRMSTSNGWELKFQLELETPKGASWNWHVSLLLWVEPASHV